MYAHIGEGGGVKPACLILMHPDKDHIGGAGRDWRSSRTVLTSENASRVYRWRRWYGKSKQLLAILLHLHGADFTG